MPEIEATVGLKLLRLAPLVISSASLMCGIDQTTALKPFTRPELAKKRSGQVLPHWFPPFANRIILVIAIGYPLAISTAYLNTITGREAGALSQAVDTTARSFYYAGMCFSAGHFLYGPYAMRIINRICDDKKPGDNNTTAAREWLRMNATRMITADFWAWFMYLCAVVCCAKF
ncbi:hypothetical protein BDR22DRAFT_932827 [Usnea florida]